MNRIFDGAVPCAAAKIPLEHARQVFAVFFTQAGRGHDHAGRTETALETLRVDKRLLHGMQLLFAGQTFYCRHLLAGRANGRGWVAGARTWG